MLIKKKEKLINVIGLMSGTSMDGIDGTILVTNGINFDRTRFNLSIPYSPKTKRILLQIEKNPLTFLKNKENVDEANYLITVDHFELVENLIYQFNNTVDLISFHGQTIYHNFKKKLSIQLGDPKYLAEVSKIKVVANFRENDIKNGGHGAPLAPIYHQSIINKMSFDLPTCFINIGGVSNLTYWDGTNLIGFDTGPGNGLIDTLLREKLGKDFDYNGIIAGQGKTNKKILKKFLGHPYFKNTQPKSLDKMFFNSFLLNKDFISLSLQDATSTISDLTANSIVESLNFLPKFPKICVIMGGGSNNKYIISRIKNKLPCEVVTANDIGLDGQYVEAELIAFLGSRHLYNLPFTFPSTTGVVKPETGGNLYTFK